MLQRIYLLTLLALFPLGETSAGTLLINSQDQWQQWTFPQGVLSLATDGSVALRHFRRNIDAVADAAEFFHLNAKGKEVQGGIRGAGTHIDQAAHILDGTASTWWQPSQEAPLDDWWVEIDLGRLVQAKRIRLTFPDTEGARPLREFSVFVTEGTPFLTGQDVFRYDRVGGTTQPSRETVIEYDLMTPELGNATGEYLATSDTLEYMSIQYVRVVAHAKSIDAALAAIEVEAIGDNIAPGTIERGGVIRTGRDVRTIANIMDGTAATWWTLTSRGDLDWRDKGDWFEWDLGATFWIDQLTMVEPPPQFATLGVNSYRNQSGFELLTSDGTPIPTQGEERLQSPVDYQLLSFVNNETLSSAGVRNRNFDFRFPARKVRYLFYHHEAPLNRQTVFHLFEIFLYGAGHPAEVVMTSNFIDLAGAKSLRRMRWGGGDNGRDPHRNSHAHRQYAGRRDILLRQKRSRSSQRTLGQTAGQPEIARSKSGESRGRLERVEFGLQGIWGSLPLAHTEEDSSKWRCVCKPKIPRWHRRCARLPSTSTIRSSAVGFSPASSRAKQSSIR